MTLGTDAPDRLHGNMQAGEHAVLSPFTQELLWHVAQMDAGEVGRVVDQARAAQPSWASLSVRKRIAVLLRFHDLVLEHRDELLDIIQIETGKARRDALEEVLDVCVNIQHYARTAPRILRERRHRGALPLLTRVREIKHPVGVVGVIAPWNYPLTLAASDAVAALIAGNSVVVKPDVQTTHTALLVARLLREAGLGEGLFGVVTGDGPGTGAALIEYVDHVMFTGSTATGRRVAEACARRLIGCTLELGGKNALIVRGDVDPIKAAHTAARAMFANTGQLCISMERVYVDDRVYDAFVEAVVSAVVSMRIGTSVGWGADCGPLINRMQFDRVRSHVDDAVDSGASLLAGGYARPDIGPLAFAPTLLGEVSDSMAVCREETFGPVAAIYRVHDDEEAVRCANDTEYGLNASILSADVGVARALARRLSAGSVNINEGYAATWGSVAAPVGGRGDSGLGVRHGDAGLLAYTESQTIASQHLLGFAPAFGLNDEQWGRILVRSIGLMRPWGR
jgi:succinate-semialdehyde dehydrogenase / glutarate-semialdehyde dehydrogenase